MSPTHYRRGPAVRRAGVLAAVAAIVAGLFTAVAGPAGAVTTVLRPNGDVANGWQTRPGGSAWAALDDPVTAPTAVPATDWIWAGSAGAVTELGLTTTPIDDKAIHHGAVRFYANTGPATQLRADVIWSGAFRGTVTLPAGQGFGWHSISVAPGGQSAVNDLRVRFTAVGGGDANVRAVYATVDSITPATVFDWENAAHHVVPEGTPSGWNRQYCQNGYALREVQTPVRLGRYAGRFELKEDDCTPPGLSRRAELTTSTEDADNADRWYAFSIHLPAGSWAPDPSPEVLVQWHQKANEGSPPLSLGIRDGRWEIVQHLGPAGNQTRNAFTLGSHATDRWTDWVVHVKWSAGATGLIQVWQDGKRVEFARGGTRTASLEGKNKEADGYGVYTKFGIYKWDWADDDPADSRTAERVVFHDELRMTDPVS